MHSVEKSLRFPQIKVSLLECWSKSIATKSRRHQGVRELHFFSSYSLCLGGFVANNWFSSKVPTLLCVYLSLCFFHCGVTQPVRVLHEGVTKASASLGGPLIPLGKATIPVPYLTAGVQHGYSSSLTLTGNVHLLTALLGDVGMDAGAAQRFVHEDSWAPELTAKAQLYFFYDVKRGNNPRLLPFLSLNASYLLGGSTLLYFGADNLFQFAQPAYFLSPFAGSQFPLSHRIDMQVEIKWMAANANTEHGVMEGHNSINGRGNIGTFLGFHYLLTSP